MAGRSSGGGETHGRQNYQGSCDSLNFDVVLSSPQIDNFDKISVGHSLVVSVEAEFLVVVRDNNGAMIGTITGDKGDRLEECLNEGYHFYVRVTELERPRCKVRVTSAG